MPSIYFTQNLQRHVACPPANDAGQTVRAALEDVFRENTPARPYVLDEQGAVRPHVVIFINGRPIVDRVRLSDPVGDTDEVYVLQALSSG